MKKFLLVLGIIFAASEARSQTNNGIIFVTTAPSGSCAARANVRERTPNGTLYTCQSGTWAVVGGGGGASPAGSLGACQIYATSSTFGGDVANCLESPTAPSTPAAPTVTKTCVAAGMETCMTTSTYVVARELVGVGIGSAAGTVLLSADVINNTNFNTITPPACVTNQLGWRVWRTSGMAPGYIGFAACAGTLDDKDDSTFISFVDPPDASSDSSFGLRQTGSLRTTGFVIAGPEAMYKQSTFGMAANSFLASGNNNRDYIAEYMATDTGGGSAGFFEVFSIYNANVSGTVQAKIAGEVGFDAHLTDLGVMVFEDWSVVDWPDGINLILCSNITSPVSCNFGLPIQGGAGYLSSDGTTGKTVTTCTGFKDGLCVSGT